MPNAEDSEFPSGFQFGTVTDRQLINLAKHAGLMIADDMPLELQEYTLLIMEKCAGIGDKYPHPKHKHTAGDEIRALFGL